MIVFRSKIKFSFHIYHGSSLICSLYIKKILKKLIHTFSIILTGDTDFGFITGKWSESNKFAATFEDSGLNLF